MPVLWLCVFLTTWAFAAPLLAQPAPLSVSRGPGADDCPDAPGLLARIEEIRKSPPRADQPLYRIVFARDAAGLQARIVSEQGPAERVLSDASQDCAALARATAVTMALLFDADTRALEEAAAAPPPAPPPAVRTQDVIVAKDYVIEPARWTFHIGGGIAIGVVAPLAPAFVMELDHTVGRFRGSLGFVFLPKTEVELDPGSVQQALGALTLGGCWAPWQRALWRFDACGGGWIGGFHAVARGFDETRDVTRFWPALAFDLRFARMPAGSDAFGGELVATVLLPVDRQDFAIENAGVAYEAPPIALQLTLRLLGGL